MTEQLGADINIPDSEGESPLHCVVLNEYDPYAMKSKDDYCDTARVLIHAGWTLFIKTPFHQG